MTYLPSEQILKTLQSSAVDHLTMEHNALPLEYAREAKIIYQGWYLTMKIDQRFIRIELWDMSSLNYNILNRNNSLSHIKSLVSTLHVEGESKKPELLMPILKTLQILIKMQHIKLR